MFVPHNFLFWRLLREMEKKNFRRSFLFSTLRFPSILAAGNTAISCSSSPGEIFMASLITSDKNLSRFLSRLEAFEGLPRNPVRREFIVETIMRDI